MVLSTVSCDVAIVDSEKTGDKLWKSRIWQVLIAV